MSASSKSIGSEDQTVIEDRWTYVSPSLTLLQDSLQIYLFAGRCLCSLSQIVGFKKAAESIFKNYQRVAFYRKPAKATREQQGRYKTPFPNILSTIIQDTKSGGLQVLSQGTADLGGYSVGHQYVLFHGALCDVKAQESRITVFAIRLIDLYQYGAYFGESGRCYDYFKSVFWNVHGKLDTKFKFYRYPAHR